MVQAQPFQHFSRQAPDFVAPQFANLPRALGQRYTAWLYGDKGGNPHYWDRVDLWPDAGLVTFRDQHFDVVVPGGHATPFSPRNIVSFELDLAGYQNAILYSRCAFVSVTSERSIITPAARFPVQSWQRIWVRQQNLQGYREISDTPITNAFGWAEKPFQFPCPAMWDGTKRRTFSLSNTFGRSTATVRLTWKYAFLQTGR